VETHAIIHIPLKFEKVYKKVQLHHHNKPRQKFLLPQTRKRKVEQLLHIPLFMLEFDG